MGRKRKPLAMNVVAAEKRKKAKMVKHWFKSVTFCLNCRRTPIDETEGVTAADETEGDRSGARMDENGVMDDNGVTIVPGCEKVVLQRTRIDSGTMRTKFCFIDRIIFNAYKNKDEVLEAPLCQECKNYMESNHKEKNHNWGYVWSVFIWQLLSSPSVHTKYGINIWCVIPKEWRNWWLPQFLVLFKDATKVYPKEVVRDITGVKERAHKLISELRLFEIEKHWDSILSCEVSCPFGCSEFVHKTKPMPMDIVYAKALELTDEEIEFVTKKPGTAISKCFKGMRKDYLTFPMNHCVAKLNNPKWEILPSVAFVNGEPRSQVCRNCEGGSPYHFLYPPRNPFLIFCRPHGERVAPAKAQSKIIKTARASSYTDRHQMLHLQGHINGVDTIRVTTEVSEIGEDQMSIPFDSLALLGREDTRAYVISKFTSQTVADSQLGESWIEEAPKAVGNIEDYTEFYESATYIAADIALKLEIDGKKRTTSCYIEPILDETLGITTMTKKHLPPYWPRIVTYVHPFDKFGCQFPCLYSRNKRKDAFDGDKYLWMACGVLSLVETIWSSIAMKDEYNVGSVEGYILMFCAAVCFPHITRRTPNQYPFKVDRLEKKKKTLPSVAYRQLLFDKISSLWGDGPCNSMESILDAVLVGTGGLVMRTELPDTIGELNRLFSMLEEKAEVECLVCTTSDAIQNYVLDAQWELRLVGGTRNNVVAKEEILCRHGKELCGWWRIRCDNAFVVKAVMPHLEEYFASEKVLVFVKGETRPHDTLRNSFLESIGGQNKIYCGEHKSPLIVHAQVAPGEGNLNCCHKEQGNCSKTIAYSCTFGLCLTCMCMKHMKEATMSLAESGNTRVHVGTAIPPPDESENDDSNFGGHEDDEGSTKTVQSRSSSERDMEQIDDVPYLGNFPPQRFYSEPSDEMFVSAGGFYDHEDLVEEDVEEESSILHDNNVGSYCSDCNDGEEDWQHSTACDGRPPQPRQYYGASTTAILQKPYVTSYKDTITSVSGSVILNNCGTLMARTFQKLRANTWQNNFLQRFVATTPGRSIPLLFAEGTLFPTIFYKDNGNGAILGALPTALLASDKTLWDYGIASVPKHLKNRLNMGSGSASTCCEHQDYLCYVYDSLANLSCRGEDTRLVVRRGGPTDNLSRKKENKNLMFDSDSIESRPHVNQLCAKMRDGSATYFGSHSGNHRDHFGLKSLKEWIDSDELLQLTKKELLRYGCVDTDKLEVDVKKAILDASTIPMLRHWQETTELYMKYICHSPEKPFGRVVNAWYRHEYQESAGNLSHLHFLLWIDTSEEDETTTMGRIRGGVLNFVTPEELDSFIADGMAARNPKDSFEIQDLAEKFLTHLCSARCMKRVNEKGELKCRVSNNGLENPTPLSHSLVEIQVPHSDAATELLLDLGLMEYDLDGKAKAVHSALRAFKHYPPARAADGKFSPCNNRCFAGTKSNQNAVFVTGYFASRYVAKYSAKIDAANRVFIGAGQQEQQKLTLDVQFLHNTKITGSKMNGEKAMAKRKDSNHPTGRAISIMEMMQVTLGYDMVYTDINFEYMSTKPMGERCGTAITPKIEKVVEGNRRLNLQDLSSRKHITTYVLRNGKHKDPLMKEWQRLSPSETIILDDTFRSDVQVDKMTIFGVRPPELRFVRNAEKYFKWFYRDPKAFLTGNLEKQLTEARRQLHHDPRKSAWIDGLGHRLHVREKALPYVLDHLIVMEDDRNFYCSDASIPAADIGTSARDSMLEIFLDLWNSSSVDTADDSCLIIPEADLHNGSPNTTATLRQRFIGECHSSSPNRQERELPVIWYDPIPPTQGHRFVVHLLLSMGMFDNEMNLFSHATMKQCFEHAKLIPLEITDKVELDRSCKDLLARYILEQLVFQPCGTKQFDRYVVAAWQTIRDAIILNELPFREMPSYLYTQLCKAITEAETLLQQKCRRDLIVTVVENLATKGFNLGMDCELLLDSTQACPVPFRYQMQLGSGQSEMSLVEQNEILQLGIHRFKMYLTATNTTVKGMIINGGPGTGKTTLMEVLIVHAYSLGLFSIVTAVMAERATQLGGIHLSHLLGIPVRHGVACGRLAEMAYFSLLRSPDRLALLRRVDVLFIDEFGQVSAELLCTMDMIMRKVRNSSQCMGGILVMGTYDYMQLPPVEGRPPLLSPLILTSFMLRKLEHSVRAGRDSILQTIQAHTRLSPTAFSAIREEFIGLVVNNCRFVSRFDDDTIPPSTLRMFGKRKAAMLAVEHLLDQMMNRYRERMICSDATDWEASVEGHFVPATAPTSRRLDTVVKEPSKLWFYPEALYEVTFNRKDYHSQSQLAVLLEIPSPLHIVDKRPVKVMLAPAGSKSLPHDYTTPEALAGCGWKKAAVTFCPERIHTNFGNGLQAKRLQYGLKPRIASTIHSGMGQDLPGVVSCVTSAGDNGVYSLWAKEQVIVLLSRTHYARDIIFVGDPLVTANALADCLEMKANYTDYMEHIMQTMTQPATSLAHSLVDPFTYNPFRMLDYQIPNTMGSFCYILVSLGDPTHSTSYIGETSNLAHRFAQHNQRNGARTTADIALIPWALLGFVAGFEGDATEERKQFEKRWEACRDGRASYLRRELRPDETGAVAASMIARMRCYSHLRYIRCGKMN